ncbi:hypothetical protein C0Q70_04498 [Pomacea canaliculata]|uniref:Uncharacterized protein n=1 Tax=Pomacea canaliculata TaxID=400727 RepID=A0A2T7PIM4_POMCA|nr:hypothetical protein C0Q70_04498 [Pomacea canaliculata]
MWCLGKTQQDAIHSNCGRLLQPPNKGQTRLPVSSSTCTMELSPYTRHTIKQDNTDPTTHAQARGRPHACKTTLASSQTDWATSAQPPTPPLPFHPCHSHKPTVIWATVIRHKLRPQTVLRVPLVLPGNQRVCLTAWLARSPSCRARGGQSSQPTVLGKEGQARVIRLLHRYVRLAQTLGHQSSATSRTFTPFHPPNHSSSPSLLLCISYNRLLFN